MPGRLIHRAMGLLGSLALLAGLSCVPFPQLGPPPMVGPPGPRPGQNPPGAAARADTTQTASEADSAAAELNRVMLERGQTSPAPELITPVPIPQPDAGGTRSNTDASRSASAETRTPGGTGGAPGSSSAEKPSTKDAPVISVDLPPRDRAKLENTARGDIAAADSLVHEAALRTLVGRERDKLETALGLSRQAREAISRGDLQAAANLAYKAKVLASEVALKSR